MAVDVREDLSDATLREVVRGSGAHAVSITRHDGDVEVVLADGRALTLLFAGQHEVDTWRGALGPAGFGPRVAGAGEGWVLIERVAGLPLTTLSPPASWELAIGWLGRLHRAFANHVEQLRAASPHLIELRSSWFSVWYCRALATLASSPDPRAHRLLRALEHYDRVTRALTALPPTLLHGALEPALMRVDVAHKRAWARDWSSAAIGPGLLDVAALSDGCSETQRARLLRAYRRASALRLSAEDLERCRLHLTLQSIATDRSPQAHDRIGEAMVLAQRLEL